MTIALNNLAPNFHSVTLGGVTVWFSYETPIAFAESGGRVTIRENEWSTTITGKHLNIVDPDKSKRIAGGIFTSALAHVLNNLED